MTLNEIKDYIVARVFPNQSQAITGETLQDTLTTMAESMNTPSGDPMHYAYEAAGATWLANTGYWKIYTLSDVTNEQMRASYVRGRLVSAEKNALAGSYRNLNAIRFNIARGGMTMTYLDSVYSEYFASENNVIEVINLTNYKNLTGQWDGSGATFASLQNSFNQCSKLKAILGVMAIVSTNINTTNAFTGCTALEDLQIKGLGSNLSFADSPINVESATYMIANANASSSFTITFRADRQAIFEANSDFIAAKSAKPNITILYQ